MIFDLKLIGVAVLLTITLSSIASCAYFMKDNNKLREQLVSTQDALKAAEETAKVLRVSAEIDNTTMEKVFVGTEELVTTFKPLEDQLRYLQQPKCPQSNAKVNTRSGGSVQNVKIETTGTVDDILAVSKLLDQATCIANGNCKPTESSPGPL